MAGDVAAPSSASLPPGRSRPSSGAGSPRSVACLRLVTFEQSLASVGISELESAASLASPERLQRWFDADPSLRELAALRTCQRVLLLAVWQGAGELVRWPEEIAAPGGWTERTGEDAVRHLFRVSLGLESRALGEREAHLQVRATATAVLSRAPRPLLRTLLLSASDATPLPADVGPSSVADLAADWLLPRLPGPGSRVLVIGAGTVGRRTAERLAASARVTVIYRQRPPDADWRQRWGVTGRPASELAEALQGTDAVVAAAKSSGRVLAADDLPLRRARPLWIVDLGLPRNIDPATRRLPGVELVDLADLPPARTSESRRTALADAAELAAEEGIRELATAAVEPWVSLLRGWAEDVRRDEWERALEHAGTVAGPAHLAFERMTDRLARRLLDGPTRELRALPPGPEGDERRRQIVERFLGPDPPP
jgi:glutamyl-tRNA reductase